MKAAIAAFLVVWFCAHAVSAGDVPCEISGAPSCGGFCDDEDETCLPTDGGTATTSGAPSCVCVEDDPTPCGVFPECGGECGPGEVCFAPGSAEAKIPAEDHAAVQGGGPSECLCLEDSPPGACCLDGSCAELGELACEVAGGGFAGIGTTCAEVDCSPSDYVPTQCASPFEDISGTGTVLPLGDDEGAEVPLGFAFEFFGNSYDMIGVSSNGYLSFGGDLTNFTDDSIPDPNSPNDLIAPLWDDFNPGQGGSVHYQTLGSAPDQRFIAQWTAVPEFFSDGSNTLQAVLFEGSNAIEFRYGSLTVTDGNVGVENLTGLVGTSVDRDAVVEGACIRLTAEAESPTAPVPALDARAIAVVILLLGAVGYAATRRRSAQ